ncbi:MAG: hypothetical protein EOO42_00120 [Flavobacteriales bacterium]|nr:MAG: hypothetical protein EOO42_00120 [Flavobacteriales bacterium]
MRYEKVQTGWIIIIIFSIIICSLTISYLTKIGTKPISFMIYMISTAILVLVLLMFYRLKVRVDKLGIHIIYGIGLVHIIIKPEKINHVKIVKIPFSSGLGIRITEKGMLYNIQGRDTVEISFLKGKSKIVQIGSNDAFALKAFIEKKYNVNQPL